MIDQAGNSDQISGKSDGEERAVFANAVAVPDAEHPAAKRAKVSLPEFLKTHLTPDGTLRSDFWNDSLAVPPLAPVQASRQPWEIKVDEGARLAWMATQMSSERIGMENAAHTNAAHFMYESEVKEAGELGDATLLKHLCGGETCDLHPRALYDPADQRWYIWDGDVFVPDTDAQMKMILVKHVGAVYGHLAEGAKFRLTKARSQLEAMKDNNLSDEQKGEKVGLASLCGLIKHELADLKMRKARLCTQRYSCSVLKWAQTLMSINQYKSNPNYKDEKVWDKDPERIGCGNGVIDMRTGTVVRGHPQEFVRQSVPTNWDAKHDAWIQTGEGDSPCPRFEAFVLETVRDDAGVALYLQKLFGYGMTGRGDLQRMLFMYGPRGGNGKSEKLKAIQHVLGRLCKPVDKEVVYDTKGAMQSAANGHKAHITNILGKHLCVVSEAGPKNYLGDNFRRMTGGFKISARGCGDRDHTEFDPTQTFIGDTNLLPPCDAAEDAVVRRLDVIHYTRRYVDDPSQEEGAQQRIQNYAEKFLFPEASGILAWMVRGYLLFLADERETGGLSVPAAMKAWKDEWITDVDPIHAFFKECVATSEGTETPSHQIHEAYQKWCSAHHKTANGGRTGPVGYRSVAAFGRRLTKLHAPGAKHTREGSVYVGLGFSPTYDENYGHVEPPIPSE